MIDNYDLFEMHEAEIERRTRHLPICCVCEEHITSDYGYRIPGENDIFCEDCWDEFVRDNCRVDIEEEEDEW